LSFQAVNGIFESTLPIASHCSQDRIRTYNEQPSLTKWIQHHVSLHSWPSCVTNVKHIFRLIKFFLKKIQFRVSLYDFFTGSWYLYIKEVLCLNVEFVNVN
jgi:hypothetical protein